MSKNIDINLNAGTASFITGMDKSARSIEHVGQVAHESEGMLKRFSEGFEIGEGVEAMHAGLELVKSGLEEVKAGFEDTAKIGREALKLGVGVEDMSRFQHAANATHTDVSTLSGGIDHLSRSLAAISSGDASAAKAADALEKMGLSSRDLLSMEPAQAFEAVSAAVSSMHDPIERAAAVHDLLGKSGRELIPVMSQLRDLMQESDAIGFTRTPEQIERVEAEERKLIATTDTVKALFMDLATSDWASTVVDSIKSIGDEWRQMLHGSDADAEMLAANRRIQELQRIAKEAKTSRDSSTDDAGRLAAEEKYLNALKEQEKLLARVKSLQHGAGTAEFSDSSILSVHKQINAEQTVTDAMRKTADEAKASAVAEQKAMDDRAKSATEGAKKIKAELDQMQDAIDTHGMTENQKKVYRIQQTEGGTAEDDQRAAKLAGQLDQLKVQDEVAKEAERLQKDMAKANGGDSFSETLADLKTHGATDQALAGLKSQHAELMAIEEHTKSAAAAAKLWEEAETPLQKYNDKLTELKAHLDDGTLSEQQYAQAVKKANADKDKIEHKDESRETAGISREFDFHVRGGGQDKWQQQAANVDTLKKHIDDATQSQLKFNYAAQRMKDGWTAAQAHNADVSNPDPKASAELAKTSVQPRPDAPSPAAPARPNSSGSSAQKTNPDAAGLLELARQHDQRAQRWDTWFQQIWTTVTQGADSQVVMDFQT